MKYVFGVHMKIGIMTIVTFVLLLLFDTLIIDAKSQSKFGPEEWTQYRMNPEKNAAYNNGINLRLNSVFQTSDQIRSTPVIIRDNMYIGNHNTGMIYSFNLKSNKKNWSTKAPNWVHSEVIYYKEKLYVGYGNRFMQKDGTRGTGESGVLCLDADNGNVLWQYKTKGQVMPTPVVYDNTLHIVTGDRFLYALELETGDELWELELGSIISMSSPSVHKGILYVGGTKPNNFYAIDLRNRKLLWKTKINEIVAGLDDVPPAIYDNKLVITTALVGSDIKTPLKHIYDKEGAIQAYKEIAKRFIGPIIKKQARENPEHMIYALDIHTGEIVWKESLGIGPMVDDNKSGAPMVYKGRVFVGSPITKMFYSIDVKTGKRVWEYKSDYVVKAPPVADKNIVYFADTGGYIYAFDVNKGELNGTKLLNGKLSPAGPVIINDNLIIGSQDSKVYALSTDQILGTNDINQSNKANQVDWIFIILIYFVPVTLLSMFLFVILFFLVKVYRKFVGKHY